MKTKEIEVSNIKIGGKNPLSLIAGPCVIEGESICFEIAEKIKEITFKLSIPFIFKASYDKANRSSINSFRGPGIEEGLLILKKIKEKLNLPITTDVHCIKDIERVAQVVDIIQIPAFLCRQTDLLLEAAKSKKVVNVKKGQFLSPLEVKNIISKLRYGGNEKILITERGSFFGYHNLVVDFRSIPIIRDFGYPVVFDATHSVQLPGKEGNFSSGESRFVPYLAKASVVVGADLLFMEVHKNPETALCDKANMINIDTLYDLLREIKELDNLRRRFFSYDS